MKQGIPEPIWLSCWRPDSTDFNGDASAVTAWLTVPGVSTRQGLGTLHKLDAGLFAYTPTIEETRTSRLVVRLRAPGMVTSHREIELKPPNAPAPNLEGRKSISRFNLMEIIAGIEPAKGQETWVSGLLQMENIPLTGRYLDGLQAAYPGVFDELSHTQEN